MGLLSIGIIAASFSARGLARRLGRLAPDATWALLLPLLAPSRDSAHAGPGDEDKGH
jgi:hypothetical protein